MSCRICGSNDKLRPCYLAARNHEDLFCMPCLHVWRDEGLTDPEAIRIFRGLEKKMRLSNDQLEDALKTTSRHKTSVPHQIAKPAIEEALNSRAIFEMLHDEIFEGVHREGCPYPSTAEEECTCGFLAICVALGI